MKNYRTLILHYSPDQVKKKNAFLKNYKLYKNQLKLRNVKFSKKINKSRSQLFNISLYSYDGKLRYISNKVTCIPVIIKKIDTMPLEKLKSIELYTNAHPHTTTKGTGYKNKEVAKKSILLIRKKPKNYQFLVINTLYQRAKYHKHQTKDMREAMKVFEKWITKYKKKNKTNIQR